MSTDRELVVQEITDVRFTPVRMREGYHLDEVDDLLDQVVSALRAAQPVDELIRSARFTPVRMREGYDMGEVDQFLERVLSAAAAADRTPSATEDAPSAAAGTASVAPLPSVVQEQRGLLARLLGRG